MIEAGPQTTYLPGESAALGAYLTHGGSALLMFDLGYELEPGLAAVLRKLSVRLPGQVVIDDKSHYGADTEMVAVTAYDPHPITRNISYTFYPGARPIVREPTSAGVVSAVSI